MRVIAGSIGGLPFESPKSFKTHPMSEKIRGAIFNMLGDVSGLHILDAFAGSGALAIEAISRGAVSAIALDSDVGAARIIAQNAQKLGIGKELSVVQAPIHSWISTQSAAQFDLIFADPPYNNPQLQSVAELVQVLKDSGLLIVSLPSQQVTFQIPTMNIVRQKDYGEAHITVFSKSPVA